MPCHSKQPIASAAALERRGPQERSTAWRFAQPDASPPVPASAARSPSPRPPAGGWARRSARGDAPITSAVMRRAGPPLDAMTTPARLARDVSEPRRARYAARGAGRAPSTMHLPSRRSTRPIVAPRLPLKNHTRVRLACIGEKLAVACSPSSRFRTGSSAGTNAKSKAVQDRGG